MFSLVIFQFISELVTIQITKCSFCRAVKSNQLEIVKLILDDDNDEMLTSKLIRAENVYGKTVIHYAAALNDSAILNFFMSVSFHALHVSVENEII